LIHAPANAASHKYLFSGFPVSIEKMRQQTGTCPRYPGGKILRPYVFCHPKSEWERKETLRLFDDRSMLPPSLFSFALKVRRTADRDEVKCK